MAIKVSNTEVVSNTRELKNIAAVDDGTVSILSTALSEVLSTDPTRGTLTKSFASGETASIALSSALSPAPVVSATKEVPQTGILSKGAWDVASSGANYDRLDGAYNTTLEFSNSYPFDQATYSGTSVYIGGQETSPSCIRFKPDGTKMFILGYSGDDISEFTLSPAWDITSATYSGNFYWGGYDTTPMSFDFNSDGTKFYIIGGQGKRVYQYSMSTAYDVANATGPDANKNVQSQAGGPNGLTFNNNGTRMYVTDYTTRKTYQYDLSTANDVSTAVYNNVSLSMIGTQPRDVQFNSDGTKLYSIGSATDAVYEFNLTTAFDLSTASASGTNFSVQSQEAVPNSLYFTPDDTKFYIVGTTSDTVYEYEIPPLSQLTLGTGSFAASDVGKTIEGNGGVAVLTAADGSYVETTAFTDNSTIAAGSWSMYSVVVNTADGLEMSSAAENTWDLSTLAYSQSFYVGTQGILPSGIFFKPDGLKMYIVDYHQDDVNEYSLTTAWDVSTASYVQSLYVNAQDLTPMDVFFKPDGLKMYIVGNIGNEVNEYDLSTAWDISTASYSQTFSIAAQETNPNGIFFKPDGLKMYIVGAEVDEVNEYNLSTAWDVSTASYSQNFSVAVQEINPNGIFFKPDGLKMYIVGYTGNDVNEYDLSTAWAISTASYSQNYSVSAQESFTRSIFFRPDGSKMYIVGNNGDSVFEYNLGTFVSATGYIPSITNSGGQIDTEYWTDINSMTTDDIAGAGAAYYAVSTDDRTTWSVIKEADGVRPIVRNNAGTWEYNESAILADTWDISTASNVQNFSVSAQETIPSGVFFKPDGTKMYIVGQAGDDVNEYDLSTAWDVLTASFLQNFSISTQEISPQGIFFKPDGLKMYVVGSSSGAVNEYNLSTAWDVSTASYSQNFNVSSQDTLPIDVFFKPDGTQMYIVGYFGKDVNGYNLTTAWNVSTASYFGAFSVQSQNTAPTGIFFKPDGTTMYVLGDSGDSVHEYSLSTAWVINTASFTKTFNVVGPSPRSLHFKPDGSKMYVLLQSTDTIHEYDLGTNTGYTTSTTWTSATTNSELYALQQALTEVAPNRMDKTQLEAVTDPNHYTLGDSLDLMIGLYLGSASSDVPSSDGVSINYDAESLIQGAILGTDYDYDFPDSTTVRVTSNAAQNLKVRVV